jgi:hypothetical protein
MLPIKRNSNVPKAIKAGTRVDFHSMVGTSLTSILVWQRQQKGDQVLACCSLQSQQVAVSPALRAAETAARKCRHFAKRIDNFLSMLALLAPASAHRVGCKNPI